MSEIGIEEFQKIDIRIGKIKEAEKIENADKLFRLKVDIGEKEIQIVAGIAKYYNSGELLNKKIIVLTNLKPVKLKGILSEGMLLAADDNKNIALLTTDKEVKEGAMVK